MAEAPQDNHEDKFSIPAYPENPVSKPAERLSDTELQRFKAKLSTKNKDEFEINSPNAGRVAFKWHENQETVHVHSGAFEFGQEMNENDTLVHCYLNSYSSSHRSSKNDNTSFNLYERSGRICLHISFRRHTQRVIFNEMINGHWGDERYIDFPDDIKDERSVDLQIWYDGGSSSTVVFNTDGWQVPFGGPADSLTYRANNEDDAMFGDSLLAQFSWRS
ncbi:hypothetical protein BJX70DRAFT_400483 [Aspergillus crustosus]